MYEWVNIHIAGRTIPGIKVGETETESVLLPSGKRIPASFADILTYRETNPLDPEGNPQPTTFYLTKTRENLRFVTMRFESVTGLDADEHGAKLTLAELEARRAADIETRQKVRLALNTASVVSLDDDEAESIGIPEGIAEVPGSLDSESAAASA